ncbi:MAG: DNA-binding protein [Pseudomonadota bacterium]
MAHPLTQSQSGNLLRGAHTLDPARWAWQPRGEVATARVPSALDGLRLLSASGCLRHIVVGVIGPRAATQAQLAAAEALGAGLGALGLTLICGGKGGVMEAACKGCDAVGGLSIGLLPGTAPGEANPFVGIALPTGLNEGRNMVIARAARVLTAVGGSYGTLSEVAYGLHFGKPVIGVEDAPQVEGVIHTQSTAAAIEETCAALLKSADIVPTNDAPSPRSANGRILPKGET